MKKTLMMLLLAAALINVSGQKSADALFKKYAGKDGYITMTFQGNLLKLFTSCDRDNGKDFWPNDLTEIRILVQEDNMRNNNNFLDFVRHDLNVVEYEEYMNISKSDQDVKMLVRTEGKHIKELLIVGGGKDNLLIQVKGNISPAEARRFSSKCKDCGNIKFTM